MQHKNLEKPVKITSIPFEELKEMVEADLELRIDQTDIDALNTPKIFNKYHKEYRIVSHEVLLNELELKKVFKELWLYYAGKGSPETMKRKGSLGLRVERVNIKLFIEGDDDYIKVLLSLEMLKNKKAFLKRILEEISQRNWHIRNAIETMKFKMGVN